MSHDSDLLQELWEVGKEVQISIVVTLDVLNTLDVNNPDIPTNFSVPVGSKSSGRLAENMLS
jgi:hypothetical protein